jgi:hypothetical protein
MQLIVFTVAARIFRIHAIAVSPASSLEERSSHGAKSHTDRRCRRPAANDPNIGNAAFRRGETAMKRFRTFLGLGISGTGLLVVLANLAHG